jgi:hypothetical protein
VPPQQHHHHHHHHNGLSCGTQSLPLERQLDVLAEVRAYGERKKRRLEKARRRGRKLVGGGPYTVPVRFVDIKASNADANVPQADIDFSFALLNEHFSTTDFTFEFLEMVRVVDSTLSSCPVGNVNTHRDIGTAYREGSTTVMNVFLCDMNSGGQSSLSGVTYFPYGK